ncbi:peptidylprolyl isomerase [Xanthobacter autotrophicus DSM 431]|uniref:peptidylprolyl isomerase n=1 Tax=Xanthobacter nonsaccharivorans TaxID=3119912 RepID=UPI0037278C90
MTSSSETPAGGSADAGRTAPEAPGKKGLVWTIVREPLVQFMALGALIFAVHAAVTPSVSKERLIEVTPEVRQSIVDAFKNAHEQREPGADEYARLVDLWLLNEITFREGLAQGLDKGDEMIRDRVTHKMRLLIFGGVDVPQPKQQELAAWYEKRRVQYDIPEQVSFIEVPFSGPDAEAAARAALAQIEAGTESEDLQNRAHIYAQRPSPTLEPSFGKDFVTALMAGPAGTWRVVPSTAGWHIVRLDTFTPGRKVPLEEVGSQVEQAWKDERRRVLAIAATRELGKAYVIRRDEADAAK